MPPLRRLESEGRAQQQDRGHALHAPAWPGGAVRAEPKT